MDPYNTRKPVFRSV